jgi:glycosyltransferase involved in cell wall biosynthesis
VDRFGPEVVYERSAYLSEAGPTLARRLGVPLLLEVNAPFPDEHYDGTWSPLQVLGRLVERRKMAAATRIVSVSGALRDHLVKQGARPESVAVVPNGANLSLFDPARVHADSVRGRHGLGDGPVIGYAGSFFRWHAVGLRTLVKVVGQLQQSLPGLHLLVVGGGEQSPADIAGNVHGAPWLTFTGQVPATEVPQYLAAMDIAVIPHSSWYASPIKAFEYGAMGRPIVAASTGPVREIMRHGQDGLLFRPNHPGDLGRALTSYLADPVTAQRHGRHFQEKVRAAHGWDTVARRLLALCSEAIQHPPVTH